MYVVTFFNNKCLYTSEIRTEAVMQALAMHGKKQSMMPMPSKRTSAVYGAQRRENPSGSIDSSSDDDSVFEEDNHSRHGRNQRGSSQRTGSDSSSNSPITRPSVVPANRSSALYVNVNIPGVGTPGSALADVLKSSTPQSKWH